MTDGEQRQDEAVRAEIRRMSGDELIKFALGMLRQIAGNVEALKAEGQAVERDTAALAKAMDVELARIAAYRKGTVQ